MGTSALRTLLHLVPRNDLDAFDALARGRLALLAVTTEGRFDVPQFPENVIAFAQFAKSGVLAVEERCVTQANKKLASGRVGILGTRHGNDASNMRTLVELRVDIVARSTGAPARLGARVPGQRIAALNHEAFDDAMKRSAVVKALLRQLLEILDGVWRDVGPEFDHHLAHCGFNYCDFICIHCFGLLCLFFRFACRLGFCRGRAFCFSGFATATHQSEGEAEQERYQDVFHKRGRCVRKTNPSHAFIWAGGGRSWIRTSVGVSQQIYSLPPLATWVSYQPPNRAWINSNTHAIVNRTPPRSATLSAFAEGSRARGGFWRNAD